MEPIEAKIRDGIKHSYRYDQVRDPRDQKLKYRCLYEKDGANTPFVLVNDPDSAEGALVILFDDKPDIDAQAW